MRALVIEDDRELAQQIVNVLKEAGYVADVAHEGHEGRYLGNVEVYDVVILDLGLPGVDGLTVLQDWREMNRTMPVLVLTARGTWRERVTGLRAGADDYLTKPFEIEELLARVEALVRRASGNANPVLEQAGVRLDTATRRVSQNGRVVELTALEYGTLSYMMHHPTKIISKTELTEHIYTQDFDRDSNVIEVLINRLRKKLGADFIKTHRGLGYRLNIPDGAE